MDLSVAGTDVEVKPEKFEQVKEATPLFHCDLFDTEVVYKIAQELLPGLASACVDNTAGGIFKSPASVAVDIRKEMVDYVTRRSEAFVAESVILEGGPEALVSDHPYNIISYFIDDFASSKRNFFSRVSGWLLSERREERVDDFAQEMEINGFWFIERREAIAQTLLKNVDFKSAFHCNMKLNSAEELAGHGLQCSFRTMNCTNEGCNARFCAAHLENHDSICPFKILSCEQKCSESIMRREMDKHCITVCPMKLVNCAFYPVGCQSTIPLCTIEQHRSENLQTHLLYILQVIHKDASVDVLKKRVKQLEELPSAGRLAEARDVRLLTFAIKDLETNLGPLDGHNNIKVSDDHPESHIIKEEQRLSVSNKEECGVSPTKKEESLETPNKKEDDTASLTREEAHNDSTSKKEECTELPTQKEQCRRLLVKKEYIVSPTRKEECNGSSSLKNEKCTKSGTEKEEFSESPSKIEERLESPSKKEVLTESPNVEVDQ